MRQPTFGSVASRGRPARQPLHLGHQSINVGQPERLASIALGSAMAVYGLGQLPWRALVFGAAGAALVYRGLSGHCHMYDLLGRTSTQAPSPARGVPAHHGVRIERTIAVDRPAEELYQFWCKLENLPRVMRHLQSVEVLDDRRSRWTASGPFGAPITWEAEIINQRDGELISWRSLPGGVVDTAGSVHFESLPNADRTLVHVELKYNPVGGAAGIALAKLLGSDAETAIHEDLDQWKHSLEREHQTDLTKHRESVPPGM
ncbi:MAG TPA: SRPBCC family protein [Pirellulales bacterium]|nr:SRPBCC family protein [Pirellulales bacterium]